MKKIVIEKWPPVECRCLEHVLPAIRLQPRRQDHARECFRFNRAFGTITGSSFAQGPPWRYRRTPASGKQNQHEACESQEMSASWNAHPGGGRASTKKALWLDWKSIPAMPRIRLGLEKIVINPIRNQVATGELRSIKMAASPWVNHWGKAAKEPLQGAPQILGAPWYRPPGWQEARMKYPTSAISTPTSKRPGHAAPFATPNPFPDWHSKLKYAWT